MNLRYLFALLLIMPLQFASADFYDRPDYFENKKIYDSISNMIDALYADGLSEGQRQATLLAQDKKISLVLQQLKIKNEELFASSLKREGISDDEIAAIMRQRPVIDAFKITLENDFLAGTDNYYTNGLRVELGFNNPEFEKFFKKLGFDHSDFFFLCAQTMYNTSNNDVGTKKPNEPPNAGLLYCGAAVNSYRMDKDKNRMRSMQRLEVQLGTIGRGSYAAQVQNAFHRLIGDKEVNWDFQVADRFYFNVQFQKFLKVGEGDLYGNSEPEYNVIIHGGGNAGTLTNYLNAGVVFNYRLMGTLIDMYVGNKITPTEIEELAMMSRENRLRRLLCRSDWSLNLYIGSEARLVFNNYRIDGDSDYYIATVPFVYDLKAGVVARYKNIFVDLGIVRRSGEWTSTNDSPDGPPHTFGMLSFTVRYNNFRELGEQVAHPVRWIVDPEYRKQLYEQNRLKDLIARDGLKIIFDAQDPKIPRKEVNFTCH